MHRLYDELAEWWPLVSNPAEYVPEVDFFLPLLAELTAGAEATLLELGSGGGNNALHMKRAFASVTLADLSPRMLEVSRRLNPECEHVQGDMRSLRLGRHFDVVFIHDAIDYMTTEEDLRRALETAWLHCRAGGMALLVPDHVSESFTPEADHGGEDGPDGRGVRYLEWSHAPAPGASSYITDYVVIVRDGSGTVQVLHDEHRLGLFPLGTWLRLLRETGFEAHFVIDDFERHVFIARKP